MHRKIEKDALTRRARNLKAYLADHGIVWRHTQCLEAIAAEEGHRNRHTLLAAAPSNTSSVTPVAAPPPLAARLVIEMDGGLIHCIRSDRVDALAGLDIAIVDTDIEGADADDLVTVTEPSGSRYEASIRMEGVSSADGGEIDAIFAAAGQPVSTPTLRVTAEVHSDDYRVSVAFDASAWFVGAHDDKILALAAAGWGGGTEADRVARHFDLARNGTGRLFDYLNTKPEAGGERVGFECNINAGEAVAWLKQNRPHLLDRLPDADDDAAENPFTFVATSWNASSSERSLIDLLAAYEAGARNNEQVDVGDVGNILDKAEKAFPGLMAHVEGLDEPTDARIDTSRLPAHNLRNPLLDAALSLALTAAIAEVHGGFPWELVDSDRQQAIKAIARLPRYRVTVRAIAEGDLCDQLAEEQTDCPWEIYDHEELEAVAGAKRARLRADTTVEVRASSKTAAMETAKAAAPPLNLPGFQADNVEIWIDPSIDVETAA